MRCPICTEDLEFITTDLTPDKRESKEYICTVCMSYVRDIYYLGQLEVSYWGNMRYEQQ